MSSFITNRIDLYRNKKSEAFLALTFIVPIYLLIA
jgi:hypothetical protein